MAKKGYQPKMVYGRPNPNYSGPDKANDVDIDDILLDDTSQDFATFDDPESDISDDEVKEIMQEEILEKINDPQWQAKSSELRDKWREAELEKEAAGEEFKEIEKQALKYSSSVYDMNEAENPRASISRTEDGNIIVDAKEGELTDNESDILLAHQLMSVSRTDGCQDTIADVLKDPSNFKEPFELHNLGLSVVDGKTEFTPDEARKLAASIMFEATNNASDDKYEASLNAFMARYEYEAEEDRLAEELRDIVGDRGHASFKYEDENLGAARKIADTEDGSLEWLQMRQTGIGGSEMLGAMGLRDYVKKDGSISTLSAKAKEQWLEDTTEDKAKTYTEDDVDEENTGAAARGHAWEPALLAHYQSQNPDVNVAVGKQTWKGAHDFQTVNVDGIITDKDGKPVGLVECKNSDKPEKWEDGVPPGYKAQVLDYLDATGLQYCDLVARVDSEMRTFRINKDDPIDSTGKRFQDFVPTIESNWDQIKDKVSARKENDGVDPEGGIRRRIDIPNDWRGVNNSAESMAGLGMGSYGELQDEIKKRQASGQSVDSAVRDIIGERFDRAKMGTMVGVDGETASIIKDSSGSFKDPRAFSPSYSSWIETGISRMDSQGNLEEKESILHNADSRILKVNGTGAEDVHGITPEMIAGEKSFRDKETRSKVFSKLMSGDAIVAHNAFFEKNHLNAAMPMMKATAKWVDTAWMGRHFMPDKVNGKRRDGKLETFAEDNGVPYENAHRAAEDAEMMMKAMNNFLSRDNWQIRPEDT